MKITKETITRRKVVRLSSTEIVSMIGVEIQWCKDNPDKTLSSDYQAGFIKGLEQARHILTEFIRQVQDDSRDE